MNGPTESSPTTPRSIRPGELGRQSATPCFQSGVIPAWVAPEPVALPAGDDAQLEATVIGSTAAITVHGSVILTNPAS